MKKRKTNNNNQDKTTEQKNTNNVQPGIRNRDDNVNWNAKTAEIRKNKRDETIQ